LSDAQIDALSVAVQAYNTLLPFAITHCIELSIILAILLPTSFATSPITLTADASLSISDIVTYNQYCLGVTLIVV